MTWQRLVTGLAAALLLLIGIGLIRLGWGDATVVLRTLNILGLILGVGFGFATAYPRRGTFGCLVSAVAVLAIGSSVAVIASFIILLYHLARDPN